MAAATLATGVTAQSIGVAVTSLAEVREDLPGGSGLQLSITHDLRGRVRIDGTVGVHRGRSSGLGTTCETYWPFFDDCRQETVRRSNDVATIEGSLRILSLELAGFRVAPGVVAGLHRLNVSVRGTETGRERRPFGGEGDAWPAVGGILALERDVFDDRARIEGGLRRMRVRIEGCVEDAWGLCGSETYTRLQVGAAYRLR
jgi:hypothetical protein